MPKLKTTKTKKAAKKSVDNVTKAMRISAKIDKLEAKYKMAKDKDLQKVIAKAINKEHDLLKKLSA